MKFDKKFNLNNIQKGIVDTCLKNKESTQHNNVLIYSFNGIDAVKLKNSIITTVNHHNFMKTRLINENDDLYFSLDEDIEINDIPIIQIEKIDDEIINDEIESFNIINNQLFQFKIFKTNTQAILFANFHDLIFDNYSINVFFNNLKKAYNDEELLETSNTYEYYLNEGQYETPDKIKQSIKYYKEQLSLADESTILNPDKFDVDEGRLDIATININKEPLIEFSNKYNIDLDDLFLASTILSLNKFTFSSKSLIYTVHNNRKNTEYEDAIGKINETLPLMTDFNNREITLKNYINKIHNLYNERTKHSCSLDKFTDNYSLKTKFLYSYTKDNLNLDSSNLIRVNTPNDSDNYLEISEKEDDIVLSLYYNNYSYTKRYMKIFLNSIKSVIKQIINNDIDNYRICDIALKEENKDFKFDELEFSLIHEIFEDTVKKYPNKTALIANDATLTYDELNKKANRIANAIIKKNIKKGSRIIFMLPRNSNLIACILGILKAGCVYIPLDLLYPEERLNYIRMDSHADYMILNKESEDGLNINELLQEEDDTNPNVDIDPEQEAYLLYTSGSTGRPKGVIHRHRDLANLYQKTDKNNLYTMCSQIENAISMSPVAFDAFFADLYVVMIGGLLVFASEEEIKDATKLMPLFVKYKVNAIPFISASRLEEFMQYPQFGLLMNTIDFLIIGGEKASKTLVNRIKQYPNSNVYNFYGSTETIGVNCTIIKKNSVLSSDGTVGNCITDIRDIDGKLLPQGVIGELYIGGLTLAKGYLNNEEKTKATFKEINNIPYMKSGDYAVELPNGELEIKGRVDTQIKLRGQRIEVEEIEFNIKEYETIKQAAVTVNTINDGEHLCAYFVAENKIGPEQLKEYLKSKLTNYMVPTFFMQIKQMPRTPTGKIDLKSLPEIKLDYENVKPETETEK